VRVYQRGNSGEVVVIRIKMKAFTYNCFTHDYSSGHVRRKKKCAGQMGTNTEWGYDSYVFERGVDGVLRLMNLGYNWLRLM
jgi:hypothetical protein